MPTPFTVRRLALLVGGGPAPGINGVISAVTIEACNNDIEVYGVQNGVKTLDDPATLEAINQAIKEHGSDAFVKRGKENKTNIRRLSHDDVTRIYDRGGSILGTSRHLPKNIDRVVEVLTTLQIDALVTIGGDDTAYVASLIYNACKGAGVPLRVAHVPKTIDNDLPLPGSTPTFGFETARHHGVSIVRNLAEDARTTSRWYIVISMGRAAGHLALGIGKASAATLTVIPEEFGLDEDGKPNNISFKHLCDVILGSIVKRIADERPYGVIVLAEGLIESVKDDLKRIMDSTSGKYGTYHTDAFGHLRLGEIGFGQLIRDMLTERLQNPTKSEAEAIPPIVKGRLHKLLGLGVEPYEKNLTFIDKDLGYELRCADPIPFDVEYTRDLGYSAVKFLCSPQAGEYGAIIGFIDGKMDPMRFEKMLNPKTNKMQTRLVNINGEGFDVALNYMIRLEEEDFNNPLRLAKLARTVGMEREAFRAEFEYLVHWRKWSNAERKAWNDKH